MKVEQKGHTTIIKNTNGNTSEFLEKIQQEHNSFKSQNLILDLSYDKELKLKDIRNFIELAKLHKKFKKSFVLVANDIDFNAVPISLTVVPTILEANDIIEMDEIERDLGF
jgi:hypothetical protein